MTPGEFLSIGMFDHPYITATLALAGVLFFSRKVKKNKPRRISRSKWFHNHYKTQSSIILGRVRRAIESGKNEIAFGILRKINPYLFEEVVLTALQSSGATVKRNKRYSGDGGIDGQCFIQGTHYYIQSKRYKSHINKAHVLAFDKLCRDSKVNGLFIHTGRTGVGAKSVATLGDSHIQIIGGARLIKLLHPEWE